MDRAVLEFSPPFPVTAEERAEYLAFAKAVAVEAGLTTLSYFRTSADIMGLENKDQDGFDPVTVADREAEAVIRERIKQTYPNHGIYGEEFGLEPGCGLTWVIDPIDGTRAFMSGMLHWGVLLALFDGENPIVGVMYQPYTDELFFGDGSIAGLVRGEEDDLPPATDRVLQRMFQLKKKKKQDDIRAIRAHQPTVAHLIHLKNTFQYDQLFNSYVFPRPDLVD